jgi:hypothetical protein
MTGLADIDELGEMQDDNVDGSDSDEDTKAISIIESDIEVTVTKSEKEPQKVEDLTTPLTSLPFPEVIDDWSRRFETYGYDSE